MKKEYYNNAEKRLLELYEKMELGKSKICRDCRLECDMSMPIGCWFVGNHFYDNEKRILFVGKNARGNPGNVHGAFMNQFEYVRDLLWKKSWPYWSYTYAISETIYGTNTPEYIAFTNLVKCNNSPNIDKTPDNVKDYCIKQLGVLRKEIEIILPTHIIFYTSWDYDKYIHEIFEQFDINYNTKKLIGNKNMPWMEATAMLDKNEMKVLRVGHLERKKKEDFVNSIVDWIKSN